MIPSIEKICHDLATGLITIQQAIEWLYIHAKDAGAELRDSFAMAALQGLLACPARENGQREGGTLPSRYATFSYQYADAMLAERAKA